MADTPHAVGSYSAGVVLRTSNDDLAIFDRRVGASPTACPAELERISLLKLAVDERGRLPTDLGLKDTVLVWPGETAWVAIDFRHPYAGEQRYLVHCHILEHEDGGMMVNFRVV